MSKSSRLHQRLSQRQALAGLLQEQPGSLAQIAQECGYDFLILDGQRGTFNPCQLAEGLHELVAANQTLAMVRLAGHDTVSLQRYVEQGADAVVVPQVSSADEARDLARTMGLGKQTSLIVILESVLGATHAEEILAVDGVDGALVGPINLSTDLGCPQDYAHPAYADALSRIERAATSTGKLLGTVPHDGYPVKTLVARGHRLFILSSDRWLLREAMSERASDFLTLRGGGHG